MIQSSGVFTHLTIPKVCSYTREVDFDSQQKPSGCEQQVIEMKLLQDGSVFRCPYQKLHVIQVFLRTSSQATNSQANY